MSDESVALKVWQKYGDGPDSIESVAFSLEKWMNWSHEKALIMLHRVIAKEPSGD